MGKETRSPVHDLVRKEGKSEFSACLTRPCRPPSHKSPPPSVPANPTSAETGTGPLSTPVKAPPWRAGGQTSGASLITSVSGVRMAPSRRPQQFCKLVQVLLRRAGGRGGLGERPP